jgi:hypothetical protein
MFATEKEASAVLKSTFEGLGWEYKEQYLTKSGMAIDFYVKAPHDGGFIFFGVECKRDITIKSKATILADYMEQAMAYSVDLNAPVFLGPAIGGFNASSLYQGGDIIKALSGLAIYGGRVNIGIFGIQQWNYHGNEYIKPFMLLRGATFWNEKGFNPARLSMISSVGSKKERTDIKIWRPKHG